MALNLNPSALAQTLQNTGYNPVDILKMKHLEKRQDKLLKDKREYDTLSKLYDTSIQVSANDYGLYQDEVMSDYNKALNDSVSMIKDGKNPIETIPNYAGFTNKIAKLRQLNQDEQKYAMFVDKNRLLSTEEKKAAIDARMKSVFYDDKGNKRSLEDATKLSKTLEVNMAKFVDPESVYKDFLAGTQQSFRQDKVTGGVSSIMLYPWQKEDEDGKIVTDINEKTGFVNEDVYGSFMSDADRAQKINYDAEQIAKKEGVVDQAKKEDIKRELVTSIFVQRGDEGSKRQFAASRVYGRSAKQPYEQQAEMQSLATIEIPSNDSENLEPISGQKGVFGVDITAKAKSVDKTIKSAYITPEGKYYVSRESKRFGKISVPVYTVANSLDEMIKSTGNKYIQSNWAKYNSGNTAGVQNKDVISSENIDKTPVFDINKYKAGVVTAKGYINSITKKPDGTIQFILDGKSMTAKNEKEFLDLVGEITTVQEI